MIPRGARRCATLLLAVLCSCKICGVLGDGEPSAIDLCTGRFPVACELRGPSHPVRHKQRLALLLVGLVDRLYARSSLRHVVGPAAASGFEVDCHVLLSMASGPGLAFRAYWLRPVPNPATATLGGLALVQHLLHHAWYANASRLYVYLLPGDVQVRSLPRRWPRFLGRPSRGHHGLLLSLLRFKKIEMLWNLTAALRGAAAYQQIILAREDLYWPTDVDMTDFPDASVVYSRPRGSLCEAISRPMRPDDGLLIMGPKVAERLLRPYSEYFQNSASALDSADNVEHFLGILAELKGIPWKYVPQRKLPYLVAMHMLHPKWHRPRRCLRTLRRQNLTKPKQECVDHRMVRQPLCTSMGEYML